MRTTRLLALISFIFLVGIDALGKNRFNVLFIAIDDLRPALGCYGDKVAKTPNIDRLAKRSIVFNRAYCQQAVCSPSRLSMLTGLRPDTIQVWDLGTHFRKAQPNAVTLPQYFKNNGYSTQSIGKIFHGGGKPSQDPVSWSVKPQYDTTRNAKTRYALPKNLKGTGLKRSSSESADVSDDTYIDGIVANAAVKALREMSNREQPFFLAVGFRKPHLPFNAPKKYWDLYERNHIPMPGNARHPKEAPELATRSWMELEGYADIPKNGKLSDGKIRELRHGYYSCVSYIDAQVGRLLNALEQNEVAEKTIVMIYGDHGFHLGEQGLWTKANNFELSTRVPLILSLPNYPGARSNALVELVDVYPSLCEAAELPIPHKLEGTSFLPVLKNPNKPWKSAVFSQYPRSLKGHRHSKHGDIMGYALRTKRYRYVEWQDWESKDIVGRELYDFKDDSFEISNIAEVEKNRHVLLKLSEQLARGWQSVLPAKNNQK